MNAAVSTPVVLLVFNRPENTAAVLRQIRRARPPVLLVVADGPRPGHPTDAEQCAATRRLIETEVDWPCEILKRYAPANLGCKTNIAAGLTWVFTQVERAIILEDDCVPEVSFFGFCEHMLARYAADDRVMMVAGANFFPRHRVHPAGYFFSHYFAIWGWATWRRAWQKYDVSMRDWPDWREKLAACLPARDTVKFYSRVYQKTYEGKIDTWDYQWAFAGLQRDGLCLTPCVNLVTNIGVDGVHSTGITENHHRSVEQFLKSAASPNPPIESDGEYDRLMFRHAAGRKTALEKFKASLRKRFSFIYTHWRL